MKNIIYIFLLCSISLYSQEKSFKDYSFKELTTALKVKLKMPRGFKETKIIKDNGHLYQYALKDSATGFEVRYYFKPYTLFYRKEEYADAVSQPETYVHFMTSVFNISKTPVPKNYPNIFVINPEYVKSDMNAEYGLSCLIEIGSRFTEGYNYCEAHAVRKDAIGEVYIFMLYNISNRESQVIRDDIFASIDFL